MGLLKLKSGQSVHYEHIHGAPDKPVLVFLHEGLGCSKMWDGFARTLCSNTQAPGLLYDRSGYGKSSSCPPFTLDYLTRYAFEELPQIIAHCIPDRPFILIGHSDGGSISLIYGSSRPPFLQAIITEAAHVFVEPVTISGIEKATRAYAKGKLDGLKRFHTDKTDALFGFWADTWLNPEFRSWNIEEVLPDIHVPLLVIQGIDDQYGTESQVNAICSQTSGNARPCMIPDCGHSPHHEQPQQVSKAMSDFITDCL